MASDQRSQIHMRVNSKQKKEWKDFIKESNSVNAMSELIRQGVTTYIAQEESDDPSRPRGTQGEVDEEYGSEILTELRNLQTEIEDLSDRMNTIEKESGRSVEYDNLASQVFHLLPAAKPETEQWYASQAGHESGSIVWSGTVGDVAEEIYGPDSRNHVKSVESTLNQLLTDTATVKTEMIDGEQRFWRTQQ